MAAANENCSHFTANSSETDQVKTFLSTTPTGELCPVRLCPDCIVLPDAPICIRCSGLLVGPRTKCNSGVFGFFFARFSSLFHAIH